MMDEFQFAEWAKELNLSDEAIKEIQRVRHAPPARRVGSGKGNVPGRFCSEKMGRIIQFESHLLELPTIYELEFNEDVVEFYDQPTQIKVSYEINGRQRKYMKTADFFVIEKEKAYWIECKQEKELVNLSIKNPERYYKEGCTWIFSPGTEYARQFGFEFLIKESSTINWILQRNLRFLEDYFSKEHKVTIEEQEYVKRIVGGKLGIKLFELSEMDISMDTVYAMIANNKLYVDLLNEALSEPDETKVYISYNQQKSIALIEETSICKTTNFIHINPGNSFIWGGEIWNIINLDNKKNLLFLLNENESRTVEIPIEIFEGYIASGYVEGLSKNEKVTNNFEDLIIKADDKDLEIANQRYKIITQYLEKGKLDDVNVTERTIRNWIKSYRNAEELFSNGYVGLLPKVKQRGNRADKLPATTKALMEEMISDKYENTKMKSAKAVYRELLVKCNEMNIVPPSYATFCKAIKNKPVYSTKKSREGKRAAYKYEEFYYYLDLTIPRHGDRIFEIAHIDHTELDIELVISATETARPWLTLMVDAFSRRILGYYMSFEEPSNRSCMMVIRDCVKKYNRLPNYLVVDGGKEFESIYFESLLALYKVHKKQRPPAKARFGNVVERLFGISNELLIHNLKGNTQIMKNVRQVTKSVNPKNHAVWTLELLDDLFNRWIEDVYDIKEIPSLADTPKNIFEMSLKVSGGRPTKYIPYDDVFILATLPSPNRELRKVQPGMGIKVNYIYYYCDEFRLPKIENSMVKVKYDPFDIGVIYAYVNNRWIKCYAEEYKVLKGKTEKQLKIIAETIKKQRKVINRNNTVTALAIANFILKLEETEERLIFDKYKAPKDTSILLANESIVVDSESEFLEETESENNYGELEIFKELI